MAVLEAVQGVVAEHGSTWALGYIELGNHKQAKYGCWRQVRLISEAEEVEEEDAEEIEISNGPLQRSKYGQLSREILKRLLINTKDPAVFPRQTGPARARHYRFLRAKSK